MVLPTLFFGRDRGEPPHVWGLPSGKLEGIMGSAWILFPVVAGYALCKGAIALKRAIFGNI